MFGDAFGQVICVGIHFGDRFVFEQGQRWELEVTLPRVERMDVVAIWDAEELVEPLPRWQELGLVAQVPLAVDGGFVTDAFEDLGNGDFLGVEPLGIA